MNLVKCGSFAGCISKMPPVAGLFSTILVCLCLVGCSDEVTMPSAGQLMEFENAGPLRPAVDMNRLVRARIGGGPYRVVNGDVLELTMPALLLAVTHEQAAGPDKVAPYLCRIGDGGTVALPLVGDIEASGKTLADIEADVIDAYYPTYTVTRPYVFVRVVEYRTAMVSITGAVNKPGIYPLRNDQMSLVALLMEAGGIIDDGAARISIVHQKEAPSGQEKSVRKALSERRQPPPEHQTSTPMDVRLSFKQRSTSSTVGELAITDPENRVLVREHLDVTREIERQAVLERLAAREPRVSTLEVNERLCSLAEQLKPGSGYRRRGAELADRRMSADTATMALPVATEVLTAANGGKPGAASQGTLYKQMSEAGKESYWILRGQNGPESAPKAANSPSKEPESLVLPVKGYNIPFADVVLHDGDTVIVERLAEPLFSVMGLVNRADNFPYPPDVQYNLMQAMAFAGGLNEAAEPRYATVYRLKPDGTIVNAVFQVANIRDGARPTEAFNIHIKPGDVVIVEHTPRTESKLFLDRVFNVNFGAYVPIQWQ